MERADALIIGAGISGLLIARKLSREGRRVIVLEARNRIGGRIQTSHNDAVNGYTECGAEFIHGRLPLTMKLLDEYGIAYSSVQGDIFRYKNGEVLSSPNIITSHKKTLTRRLQELKHDLPVTQFLSLYFDGPEFADLRADIKQFVEGYDSADIDFASTFAFRREWQEVNDWKQYRIDDGYGALADALAMECISNGCTFHLACEVKTVHWQTNNVTVVTAAQEQFSAPAVAITCPLNVLQSGSIAFVPPLPTKLPAMSKLKMGHVIKVHLFFREEFWKRESVQAHTKHDMEKLGFLLSDAVIPTWWTQHPDPSGLLTGWVAGPKALRFSGSTSEEIFTECIRSLSYIFGASEEELRSLVNRYAVHDWSKEKFTQGAYHYTTVDSDYFAMMASDPIENTIYFAGEAFGGEDGAGLVEAAINSGIRTAKIILPSTGQNAA